MQRIDVETWPRREHFRLYQHLDQPHFNMCANVDLTAFYSATKTHGIGFTAGVLYVIARAANDIPAFRYRMRGDEVIEHETVHPSTTVLSDTEVFGFCSLEYDVDLRSFATTATQSMDRAKQLPALQDGLDRDDILFTTSIPWVSFTSFAHPTHLHPVDCIPRMAWGKRFADGDRIRMPLSVQGHHALMDGYHMGQYYERVQAYLSKPDRLFETD